MLGSTIAAGVDVDGVELRRTVKYRTRSMSVGVPSTGHASARRKRPRDGGRRRALPPASFSPWPTPSPPPCSTVMIIGSVACLMTNEPSSSVNEPGRLEASLYSSSKPIDARGPTRAKDGRSARRTTRRAGGRSGAHARAPCASRVRKRWDVGGAKSGVCDLATTSCSSAWTQDRRCHPEGPTAPSLRRPTSSAATRTLQPRAWTRAAPPS